MQFKGCEGSATTWAISLILILFLGFTLILSTASVIAAQTAAGNAADLIAMSGCQKAIELSQMNNSELISCNDDGVSISVETRSTINLPLRVKRLYAHARAQSVHEM